MGSTAKYCRKAFYKGRRLEIGHILRELRHRKGIGITEIKIYPAYILMLPEMTLKYSVSSIMWYLIGKSSLPTHEWCENVRYKYRAGILMSGRKTMLIPPEKASKNSRYIWPQLNDDTEQSLLAMRLALFMVSQAAYARTESDVPFKRRW